MPNLFSERVQDGIGFSVSDFCGGVIEETDIVPIGNGIYGKTDMEDYKRMENE